MTAAEILRYLVTAILAVMVSQLATERTISRRVQRIETYLVIIAAKLQIPLDGKP